MHSLAALLLLITVQSGLASFWAIVDSTNATKMEILRYNQEVTKLLDSLLRNYEKRVRPSFEGAPLIVTVDIDIRSMDQISDKNMAYSLQCYFRQSWRDNRLAYSGPKELSLQAVKVLQDIWKPDTYIRNGKHSFLHMLTVPNRLLRLKPNGEILLSQRLTLTARCHMRLRKFPMDTQYCNLEIGSLGYSSNDIIYKWKRNITHVEDLELSQFELKDISVSTLDSVPDRFNQGNSSVLVAKFELKRQQGYYLLQTYVPCVMITALSWVSFWINEEAAIARVSLGVTTVLTLCTLRAGAELPDSEYSNALDVFLLVSFGFVLSALVEYIVLHFAHFSHYRKLMKMSQRSSKGLKVGLQKSAASLFIPRPNIDPPTYSFGRRKDSGRMRKRLCSPASELAQMLAMHNGTDDSETENEVVRVYDWIDTRSQFLFPALYVCFNVGYWTFFLYF